MTNRIVFSGGNAAKADGDVLTGNRVNDDGLFGDGSDGAYSDGGDLTQGKVYNFTSFSLTNGNTLNFATANSADPIIVKVQGNCTIAGTVDGQGHGYAKRTAPYGQTSSSPTFSEETAGSDSPGAGAITAGLGGAKYYPHKYYRTFVNDWMIPVGTGGGDAGNPSNTTGSGGGGGGSTYNAVGSSGDAGDVGSGGSTGVGGDGGSGGGVIIFFVGGNFTLSATGIINVKGADGTAGTGNGTGGAGGGGGGGGGGNCLVLYKGTLTDSGTKQATGGAGGAKGDGSGDGGAGGAGGNGSVTFTDIDTT